MLILVVPAYNEEQNIGRLIEEVDTYARKENLPYSLIVIDDGSRDRTARIVREKSALYPCQVVSYTPNQGVGEAFRRGLLRALTLAGEGDRIVTLEADGTGDLNILPELLACLERGSDVALASCYAKGGTIENASWDRIFLSRAANFLIHSVFPMKGVHTYSSFYRAYRPEILRRVLASYGDFYEESGFACVIELLVRISRLRGRMEEVPMILRSQNRRGKSKMKIFPTMLGYLRVIRRNAFFRPKL